MNKLIIIFLLFLTNTFYSYSQKVGIVLSGGGTKGLAHIGMLKALEENNIPIDYITGTSMGAIIGGLYSIGYSPEEIEIIMTSEEVKRWAEGKIDKKYYYYYKQSLPNASWDILKLKINDKFKPYIPTNIVSTFLMDFQFMEIFSGANVACKGNFDSLFVPFRCVATDIDANTSIVLKNGDLGKSIRASMTFPFYFKPIEIDNKILFDGGIYNNFPADVMYNDFYPDIIIGSKVANNFPASSKDDILSQIQNMLVGNTKYDVICHNGILIEPDVEKVGLIDFSRAKEFIDSGYSATIKQMDIIKQDIRRRINTNELKEKRDIFKSKQPIYFIDKITTKGLSKNQHTYVNNILYLNTLFYSSNFDKHYNKKKKNVLLANIKDQYFKMIAEGYFENAYPSLVFDSISGNYNFIIEMKKENNIDIEFGAFVSSNPSNEAFAQLNYNYLNSFSTNITTNVYFGKLYNSVMLKGKIDFPKRKPFFLETSITHSNWNFFKNTTYFLLDEENPTYLIKDENFSEINIGFPIKHLSKLTTGVSASNVTNQYYQNNYFSKNDTTDRTKFNFLASHISYERNTLDKKQYAKKGSFLSISLKHINGVEHFKPGSTSYIKKDIDKRHEWFQFKITYDNYFKSFGKLKLGCYSQLFTSNQRLFSNYTSSLLSTQQFNPLPENQRMFNPIFRANSYVGIGLKTVYSITQYLDFRLEGYVYQPYKEIIKKDNYAFYGEKLDKRYFILSSSLVFNTLLFPISLNFTWTKGQPEPFTLSFNLGYIIFNKTPID
ncbi:MAG: hypothetical protein A2X12_12270 [Bacteroidetes bacterium GWE2_29_8]|nr:MAG: hypothetical protein A2X12_12270 [Bacteroidetes bacterium GWE2_29_8]OFY20470.1 MAG: hypothetical protein A2X02_02430 [Bacteroidetes bacterium GWF2_29_10]